MTRQTITANDLLMTCPDDQITRMQIVWKRVAAGQWQEAAHHLRGAAAEGDTSWHSRCAELADEYQTRSEDHAQKG